jgi:catechol 2,3-dioxygenase-like lactoylglutathione lyase family enzyme
MFSNATITAIIPVTDLERARDFYEGLLGFQIYTEQLEQGSVTYKSRSTFLTVYQRQTASSGEHTVAAFDLAADFDDVVNELLDSGIIFDTFDIPGVDMPWDERGVLSDGDMSSAWFKDPDGNVLAIGRGLV